MGKESGRVVSGTRRMGHGSGEQWIPRNRWLCDLRGVVDRLVGCLLETATPVRAVARDDYVQPLRTSRSDVGGAYKAEHTTSLVGECECRSWSYVKGSMELSARKFGVGSVRDLVPVAESCGV